MSALTSSPSLRARSGSRRSACTPSVGLPCSALRTSIFFCRDLPLIGVSIPTLSFFWLAPPLITALHTYFHLHLLKLWDALAAPEPHSNKMHLSEQIQPWLVSDWALEKRADGSLRITHLSWVTSRLTFVFVWVFGIIVLAFFWWRAMLCRMVQPRAAQRCGLPDALSLPGTRQRGREFRAEIRRFIRRRKEAGPT